MPVITARDYNNAKMNPKSTGIRHSLTVAMIKLCALFFGITAAVGASDTPLPPSVVELMQANGISESSISVVMRKVGSAQSTVSYNAATSR
ncbi:uncharacterized protein METZ01_LOCUS218753, partial [marine metagenome]